MSESRAFDVLVYGATGFTGRLVAEYLARQYGDSMSWAMAGRSADKLARVREEINAPPHTALLTADADSASSLEAMVNQARVVITTVGPYQLYGNELVAACARTGTDYVDLCGEPAWMHQMIGMHSEAASRSGARIVFSCGFDSIPFDLGVLLLQEKARAELGRPANRVRGRVRSMKGRFSGGTAASFKATMAAAAQDPAVIGVLRNHFALTPGFEGPEQPGLTKPVEDTVLNTWCAPFIMAPINTKNIHRSNFLMGHPYGEDFVYDEMVMTGPGDTGEDMAKAMARSNDLGDKEGPKPGEGPSKEEREAGSYDLLFVGHADDAGPVQVVVTGDMDPGYGSTSKMISEAALCLTDEASELPGGIYTPAAAFGLSIIDRLRKRAGMTFD
ncbi:MAG: saccharopine dehydrogenase NADP-binding domain-containing protein [Xanthomonadales bacterium]|nr:saccharopine dehydrogenase NADP-binding domain-containing protein [Xanthomonadales bacterium]